MKNPLIAIVAAAALVGCGGLHVSWTATASYNADAVTRSQVVHQDASKK
ncbi:hypothetical protein [Acidovorax sp. LjRoot194]